MAANPSVAVPTDPASGTPRPGFFRASEPRQTGSSEPGLENTANNLARAGQRRVDRWEARSALWRESSLSRVQSCGRWAITSDGTVQVRANGRAVGFAGLASCGSVWACPVCNWKIQNVRRIELGVFLAWAMDRGGVAFGAYTLRHHAGMPLDPTWRALSKCWEAVARDKSVRYIRARLGHVGIVRAAETTMGANGWHPHIHPLHAFEAPVSPDDVAELHAAQYRAWEAAAGRLGLEAPTFEAQHLHAVTDDAEAADGMLSRYLTKAEAVAWEATSTQTKSDSRGKGRTPWQILDDFRLTGDLDDLDLWHHWERASKGKRALTWSRGLRKLAGLDVEATDEQIAEAEVGSREDTGLVIADWAPIRDRPALGAQLLNAISGGRDWAAGRRFCADNGIELAEGVN